MIEQISLRMTSGSRPETDDGSRCETMNPKRLLLYAAAECAGLAVLHVLDRGRIRPVRLEVGVSGDLSADGSTSAGIFRSFHVVYNVACSAGEDQLRISRAVKLAHERYCGLMRMLNRIAPVSYEVAIACMTPHETPVASEPQPV